MSKRKRRKRHFRHRVIQSRQTFTAKVTGWSRVYLYLEETECDGTHKPREFRMKHRTSRQPSRCYYDSSRGEVMLSSHEKIPGMYMSHEVGDELIVLSNMQRGFGGVHYVGHFTTLHEWRRRLPSVAKRTLAAAA